MRYLSIAVLIIAVGLSACSDSDVDRLPANEFEMNTRNVALEAFTADIDRYPTTTEGIQALVRNPGLAQWRGPYLGSGFPLDRLSLRVIDATDQT